MPTQLFLVLAISQWRLDLDWRWHQRGLELGCIFSINPDAHSIAELDLMRWGLAMARKGGVSADRVLNARHAMWQLACGSAFEPVGQRELTP